MISPSLEDQFAASAALEFALHFLQRWSKTPWISENTTKLNVAIRAVLAFVATIGITWHYNGGTLVITGLTVSTIAAGLWHVFRQFALQHGFGHLIRNGNLDKFQAIVQDVVRQELVSYMQGQQVQAPALASSAFPAMSVSGAVKSIAIAIIGLALFAHPARAQESNIYAGGISFNSSGSPRIAGTGLYARLVSPSSGTYAFTVVDALPNSVKPFTVTSNFAAGVAQKVFTIGSVPIFVPTAAGVSFTGSNTGWAWSTGGAASIKLKGNWRIFPNVRIVKSSVSNGAGYQPIVGILFGWAQ